ncbi:MAG: hypothetical protein KDD43_12140, partial [Bdellovibrionales bacterium]|nr:hypothetical protein [Bdellovibrionales bacterium]
TTTLKTGLNELLKGGLNILTGGSAGGGQGQGQGQADPVQGAANAAKQGIGSKILGGVRSALGLGSSGGEDQAGVVNIQAGVVNVAGSGGAAAAGDKLKDAVLGESGGDKKGFFAGLKDSIAGVFGDIKGLFGGGGGGFGGVKSAAASLGKKALGFLPSLFGLPPMPFARGGIIKGPGTSTSDSIPGIAMGGERPGLILVSNGEAILNAKAVDALGPDFINAVNSMSRRKFAVGGLLSSSMSTTSSTRSAAAASAPANPSNSNVGGVTVVNINDPRVQEDYVARSRRSGQIFLNNMQKNDLI